MRTASLSFVLLLAFARIPANCATQAQPATKAAGQVVTSDSSRTTPAGATFMVPAGWSIATEASSVTLQPPEPDTHIAIFDTHAADAAAAVASAWGTYRPDMKRPLKLSVPIPDRNGWKDGKQFVYETSPNERAVAVAVALHSGDTWTVVLLDGAEPTFEKRGAQINLIVQSLRPKAYQRESFAGRKAHPLTPDRIETLKTFVQTAMQKLGVPGASLALIDNGKVVYEGGLGVRELGKPTPVDANTLFMAASNTKGMTTLLLARLVDAHKLQWEEPVTRVYPDFKLGDANTTRQVEIKHLICACTGLPRQDLEWIFEYKKFTAESTFALLSGMQPTSRFGEVFQYSNLMASAAGYVGAHLYEPDKELGAAYDDAMQKQIFDPLGMTVSTFDMERAQHGNFASPHADDIDGHPAVATMDNNYSVVPFRPAGGVWTSAHDMTRYALLELSRGKLPNGEQFVSEENLLMRRKPQIATGEDETYGMGLEVNSRWGVPVVHHGGSLFGYKSDWMILPDSGIGAVLLTNADNGGMMLHPFMRRLLEVVFDGKPEAVGDLDSAAQNYRAYLAKERPRLQVPASNDETAKLAPHYNSSALGNITVEHDGANTVFGFDGWKSTMASRKNDDGTISFITIDPTRRGFEFVEANRNGKRALIIRDGQHEYVFTEAS
ncbi:MAG: beta-lactamase family protein [Acidobacteriaceae bacterium]|nr:beta-lactamase family protein [Acidobacteriaceae bacterium]MBV9779565.1 beta-lactamase family protein [Acidobacteriaceae bacterium]